MTDPPGAPADRAPVNAEAVRVLTKGWWLLLLIGVLSIVAGVIVLAKPSNSLATLTVICGVFVLIDSIVELAGSFFAEHSAVAAVIGAVGIVIGILLIRHPIHGVLAAAFLIGVWLVAVGVLRLLLSFALRRELWGVMVPLVQIVAGVILVASPHIGFAALALIVGLSFIASGVASVGSGLLLRRARHLAPEELSSSLEGSI